LPRLHRRGEGIGFVGIQRAVNRNDFLARLAALFDGDHDALAGWPNDPRRRDRDAPVLTKDTHHVVQLAAHAAGHARHDVALIALIALELQDRSRPLVRSSRAQVTRALKYLRLGEVAVASGSGEQARHRNRVAADIQDAAAAQSFVQQARPGIVSGAKSEAGLDHLKAAQLARADQLDHAPRLRVAAIHEGFHEHHIGVCAGFGDGHRLRVAHAQRLLAQHVLARPSRGDGPLRVHRMRRRDVNRLHFVVPEQGLVSGVAARHFELVAEFVGAGLSSRAHRSQGSAGAFVEGAGEGLGDGAGSEDAPAQWSVRHDDFRDASTCGAAS